jgi:Na+/melibiose symporter-like transporter
MIRQSLRWLIEPSASANIDERNYRFIMMDAAGIGVANSAAPFLNIFLVNLGATNTQIGILASLPALAGFIMVLFVGQFIQKKGNLTKWASISIWLTYSGYFFTGVLPFFIPRESLVVGILIVWGIITIPQTVMGVSYPIMINSVAGENGRFELTTRRWAFLGCITAILTAVTGQLIELINYPFNYQLIFMVLSIGGIICFTAVRNIRLPAIPINDTNLSVKAQLSQYLNIIKENKSFTSFVFKRFIHFLGATLVGPIVSLYYIREVGVNAGWIGIFSTTATITLIIGYFFWLKMSHKFKTTNILLLTTLIIGLWPLLLSTTKNESVIVGILIMVGFFQAGIDLVFFDELMKTIPAGKATLFISVNMLFQYFANFIGPLLGTSLAEVIGLGNVLIVGSGIKLLAFMLFAYGVIQNKQKIKQSAI